MSTIKQEFLAELISHLDDDFRSHNADQLAQIQEKLQTPCNNKQQQKHDIKEAKSLHIPCLTVISQKITNIRQSINNVKDQLIVTSKSCDKQLEQLSQTFNFTNQVVFTPDSPLFAKAVQQSPEIMSKGVTQLQQSSLLYQNQELKKLVNCLKQKITENKRQNILNFVRQNQVTNQDEASLEQTMSDEQIEQENSLIVEEIDNETRELSMSHEYELPIVVEVKDLTLAFDPEAGYGVRCCMQ